MSSQHCLTFYSLQPQRQTGWSFTGLANLGIFSGMVQVQLTAWLCSCQFWEAAMPWVLRTWTDPGLVQTGRHSSFVSYALWSQLGWWMWCEAGWKSQQLCFLLGERTALALQKTSWEGPEATQGERARAQLPCFGSVPGSAGRMVQA